MTRKPIEKPCGPHVPVLLDEVLAALDLPGTTLAVDGTFGAGGYTRAMLAADPDLRVVGIDRDPSAIAGGAALVAASNGRLTLVPGRFGALDAHLADLGEAQADRIVLDIGVSSMQIDQPERGFSFRNDGPLDMRMAATGLSAADLVNEAEEVELADIIYHYGEERRSRAVARTIIEARRRGRIETTAQLADLVAGVVRTEPGSGIHPATRTFQGLRIAVNDELGELVQALHAAERMLRPGGRLAVVTFHSLEDRIVKQFFSARSGRAVQASRHMPSALPGGEPTAARSFTPVTKGPVLPSDSETARNPRSRSAKLRAAERTDAPVPAPLAAIQALAALPEAPRGGARR
ncbi:16S rRNA (cytosine(1402)-N(4))-methyltransferase RsmH [Methylobacterium sp. WL103]|uniref:16S rRNA (cytosine(1402)-N(4))-methyltransferase RsmH n=1 Tax=unclassified Methylobacterium TaxID=2615210 RepID=UPI0011C98EBE|nr:MULTISPECIES: 16S rRNA (cytosine(1402)-N(4))-methyltransferase RsmH [unclassified Methylobacterium]TXM63664.1 16S rRNA (cytosine(1402)-N(4))-methyltransferase RsmH [Methylobacterium sp. WL120]TXM68446.1 16S rRNA (cytosine(1402)-N(4))-methyltransferase RsmH [Methylobacterium sp. WL12]TXM94521.1 16S rRNA (cytosine(1402)-N(4))-methyltransferase RsmH [Methylobacterium sp. WL103]TXN84851.1 16S rRNA (cytosine(1402)-N(4))-methyltransferase RsmH [Methylobacterium sp. WL8]